jgi:predicted nucleic acid-binding protein
MPNRAFLDTSGWLALLHSRDVNHKQANKVWLDLGEHGYEIVLTDWIIAETGNGLSRTRIRHLFPRAVDQLWSSSRVSAVMMDRMLIAKAIEYYRRYSDKFWGLVDCASFVVMQERGITEAFTSDQHFEQAGFKCLLSA